MFNIGDSVLHLPTQTYFTVTSKRRNRKTSAIALYSDKTPYPASECLPDERELPLDDASLQTVLDMIAADSEVGYPAETDLLGALTPQQKAQVWVNLPIERQNALKAAGRAAA